MLSRTIKGRHSVCICLDEKNTVFAGITKGYGLLYPCQEFSVPAYSRVEYRSYLYLRKPQSRSRICRNECAERGYPIARDERVSSQQCLLIRFVQIKRGIHIPAPESNYVLIVRFRTEACIKYRYRQRTVFNGRKDASQTGLLLSASNASDAFAASVFYAAFNNSLRQRVRGNFISLFSFLYVRLTIYRTSRFACR